MRWTSKPKSINPIPIQIEIKLLHKAYAKSPCNTDILDNLLDALILSKQLDQATELCKKHLENHTQNQHIQARLGHLYYQQQRFRELIKLEKHARFNPTNINITLLAANALAQQGNISQAITYLQNLQHYSKLTVCELRLLLNTHLCCDLPEKACLIYQSLNTFQRADSGVISQYIKALFQLKKNAEVDQLIDHETLIKKYTLFQSDIDEGHKTNQQLTEFLSSHSRRLREPGNHTTRHGDQIQFESHWHESTLQLEDEIKPLVQHYLAHTKLIAPNALPKVLSLQFWGNILGKHGHQISHIHPAAVLSGVYYIKVPPSLGYTTSTQDRQGWLKFSQVETSSKLYIKPENNLLVIFPSYFFHETIPLKYDEKRICIAFDVVAEPHN